MKCIKSIFCAIFQKLRKIYLKCYWYVFGVVFVAFCINFFGGIIYGITNKGLVEQRTNHLKQTAAHIAGRFNSSFVFGDTITKLPAIFVNASFDDVDGSFSFDSFLSEMQAQGWKVYSADERLKKARLYNENFIVEIEYIENNKQMIISVTFNEVWTRIEWLRYIFVS